MSLKVLTEEQVQGFIERGYVHLREAFPREQALAAQDYLWERVEERGPKRDDPSTWTEPMVHIKEAYTDPVFAACMTEKLAGAIEDLEGQGRWRERGKTGSWGWWPVNFALGADRPWDVPTGGWHWDGIHFRHRVNAPDQGLLMLCMFSDIASRGGGTLVAEGSHQVVARFLAQHPDGIELRDAIGLCYRSHPWLADLTGATASATDGEIYGSEEPQPQSHKDSERHEGDAKSSDMSGPAAQEADTPRVAMTPRIERFMERVYVDDWGTRLRVVETTASPGDVFLCHPFLYHAASQNHLRVPRFMCNRTTPLFEPMTLDRPDGEYSPLELSIRRALQG